MSLPKSRSLPGQEESQTQGTGGDLEKTGHGSKGKAKNNWTEDEEGTAFDLVVGCDGSWSKVRSEMMRVERYVSSDSTGESLIRTGSTSRNRSFLMRISNCICLPIRVNQKDLE